MSENPASSENPISKTFSIEVSVKSLQPGLYIISTPIGNLQDISLRALNALREVDFIACEDNRVVKKLLTHYGIKTPTFSYHDHNSTQKTPKIVEKIQAGQSVALVSDAGTPLVSDPGYELVRACVNKGVYVTAIPGVSASIMALSLSGLPTDQFFFGGFLPAKKGQMKKKMEELKTVPSTLVFYESPRRLVTFLETCLDVFGNRDVVVARELTKMFEEVRRGSVSTLLEEYKNEDAPKGEVVVLVGPGEKKSEWSEKDIKDCLAESLKKNSLKDSVGNVVELTGWAKKAVYQLALEVSKRSE